MNETQKTTQIEREGEEGMEIYHRDYNLDQEDNLDQIPDTQGVLGIFSLIRNDPSNCRLIKTSGNLRETVKSLFENADNIGVKKFMQGPWIKFLKYLIIDSEKGDKNEIL